MPGLPVRKMALPTPATFRPGLKGLPWVMGLPELGFPLKAVREGLAEVLVPAEEVRAPRKAPVFYNPVMALNRDVAVSVLRVFSRLYQPDRPVRACEPLCGCGVRGIRFALEVPGVGEVVMGDLNPNAVRLSEENIKRNNVADRVSVRLSDANVLLTSYSAPGKRFDYVDLDPFGSPAPFMDSAVRALRSGGLLALTATDMAPLCGTHARACLRKYGAQPARVPYVKEVAVRILLGALARVAAAHDVGIRPLLTHATDHYARAYCLVLRGQGKANESISQLGWLAHCPSCHERELKQGLARQPPRDCPSCGSPRLIAGPLWAGPIFNSDFCRSVAEEASQLPWLGKRTRKLLDTLASEAPGPPLYYSLPRLCDAVGISIPPTRELVSALRSRGWWASRTHFDPQAVRTDAPVEEVVEAIRALAA